MAFHTSRDRNNRTGLKSFLATFNNLPHSRKQKMAPLDYVHARNVAKDTAFGSCHCSMIDGMPYFPNFIVPSGSAVAKIERDNAICKIVQKTFSKLFSQSSSSAYSISDVSSWKVAPITGGNTNQLFSVTGILIRETEHNESESEEQPTMPSEVLVRLFGAEGMIDRDFETATYDSLARQNLALKWYGRFGNGRIEQLLVGYQTLTEEDLMKGFPTRSSPELEISEGEGAMRFPPENLNEEIARKLARLHSTYQVPLHLLKSESHADGDSSTAKLSEPTLWTQLYPWLEQAVHATFLNEYDSNRATNELKPALVDLKAEIDWLKSDVIHASSNNENDGTACTVTGIGFCHNDLLASNIMMLVSTTPSGPECRPHLEELHFVDFEYGGINYFAYDIANHFNEYAGGTAEEDNATPDYNRCPSSEERASFLRAYVDEFNSHCCRANDKGKSSSKITVEKLEREVDGFSLANHLVWGLWGVLQAATEGCEEGLDYLHYAKCRFDRYRHDKEKLENIVTPCT